MDALRPGKLRRLIPRKILLEYPAFESGQGSFSRLDRKPMCGSGATGAGPGANRVAWKGRM